MPRQAKGALRKSSIFASRRRPLLRWCKRVPSPPLPFFPVGKPTDFPLGKVGRQASCQVARLTLARNQESLTCVTTHRHIGFLRGISLKVLFHRSNAKCEVEYFSFVFTFQFCFNFVADDQHTVGSPSSV